MNKMILKDGSEIQIHEGAGLSAIVASVKDYTELEKLSGKLTPENLRSVKFEDGANVTGIYTNMTMLSPRFRIDDADDGSLAVTFGIRALTEEELRFDALEQQVIDTQMALCEVYELLE